MPVSRADRAYIVGETVHLHVKVSRTGTKQPQDPNSVTLSSLVHNGVSVVLATTAFTKQAVGDYTLVIPTAGRDVGTYDLTVTVESGPDSVVIMPDRFVLQAPTVT